MDDTDLANGMLALVPEDGSAVGNVTLRSEWTPWAKKAGHKAGSRDEYWRIRQVLLDDGRLILGKGKGGSVRRAIVSVAALETKRVVEGTPPPSNREISLYSPIKQTIEHTWAVAELGLPENSFQLCVSAFQGKADTGGKWSRPDITLVSARRFAFLGPRVEVVTFEVKPFQELAVDGVFEAAAHTARAHKAYLLAEVPEHLEDEFFKSDKFDRLETECLRFGVGLATFSKAEDADTWQVHVRPSMHSPDPSDVEAWVAQCFKSNTTALARLIDRAFSPEQKRDA